MITLRRILLPVVVALLIILLVLGAAALSLSETRLPTASPAAATVAS